MSNCLGSLLSVRGLNQLTSILKEPLHIVQYFVVARPSRVRPKLKSTLHRQIDCQSDDQTKSTEENHSNEHASYEIPPLTKNFESPIILSLDSLLKKNHLKRTVTNEKSPVTKSFPVKMVFLSDV